MNKAMPLYAVVDAGRSVQYNNKGWGSIIHINDISGGNASIIIIDIDEQGKYKLVSTSGTEKINNRWEVEVLSSTSFNLKNITSSARTVRIKEL